MADTGKQSPLGQNVLGGILQNRCIRINPNAQYFMGTSRSNTQYTFGALVERTVKQGTRTGTHFIGCSGYPKCRFTLN